MKKVGKRKLQNRREINGSQLIDTKKGTDKEAV